MRVMGDIAQKIPAEFAFPVRLGQADLAKADDFRRHFNVFVVFNVFKSDLQGEFARGLQENVVVGAGGPLLVSSFADRVDDHVSLTRVLRQRSSLRKSSPGETNISARS